MASGSRTGIFVVICMGLSVTISQAARPDENLFPVKVGNTWSFWGNAGAVKLEMSAACASVKADGKKSTVVVRWSKDGVPVQDETYIVSSASVLRARSGANGSVKMDPPFPVIEYPVKVGKTWNWSGTVTTTAGTNKATAVIKVVSKDLLKTSAGLYSAYRIDSVVSFSYKGKQMKVPNAYWFAPDVGMVQQRMVVPGPGGKAAVVDVTVTSAHIKK